jgi:hypothetical protein
MKRLLLALALTAILATPAQAQQSTQLGRWAQLMAHTPIGQYMGCNRKPPASTYCWRVVVIKGEQVATIHYKQTNKGVITWRTK